MKIIVIGSRAYNELVGRIEKIEAAIASLPEKGRAWNKEYINDEWMDGEQVCRYLGISGRTLQRLRSDHVITYSAINRKLYLFPHGNPPCAEGAFRAAQKPTKGIGHVSGQGIFRRMDAAALGTAGTYREAVRGGRGATAFHPA